MGGITASDTGGARTHRARNVVPPREGARRRRFRPTALAIPVPVRAIRAWVHHFADPHGTAAGTVNPEIPVHGFSQLLSGTKVLAVLTTEPVRIEIAYPGRVVGFACALG